MSSNDAICFNEKESGILPDFYSEELGKGGRNSFPGNHASPEKKTPSVRAQRNGEWVLLLP